MHLSDIDYLALYGNSFFHKRGTISKVIFSILIIASIMISKDIYKLITIAALLVTIILFAKLPLKKLLHLAMYPAFFSVIFALLSSGNGLVAAAIVVFKAMCTATTMLILITTTPYTDIFGVFSLFMPDIIVDIFLLTYRSLFIMINRISKLFTSIKVRGGMKKKRLIMNIKNMVGVLGTLILMSFEMSERMYKIYNLRGFNGKIPMTLDFKIKGACDIVLVMFGAIIMIGAIIPWNQLFR